MMRRAISEAGIIPACAGSTRRPARRTGARRDHPRLRGEHSRTRRSASPSSGSSPLARGALGGERQNRPVLGIIPACAGSTRHVTGTRFTMRDHPRLRGEHRRDVRRNVLGQGSSPLARGALDARLDGQVPAGIIPACAGSTTSRWSSTPARWDHPRLRGEHTPRYHVVCEITGSSPLARGAPYIRLRTCTPGRIIPACAGSTCSMSTKQYSP